MEHYPDIRLLLLGVFSNGGEGRPENGVSYLAVLHILCVLQRKHVIPQCSASTDYDRQKAKEAKLAAKLGYRPLPPIRPCTPTSTSTTAPAPATSAPAAPAPSTANPAFGSGPPPAWNPTTWAHLPPLEEFGVRRPFDAPGRPPVDIGGTEWPKMSRTMTHVSATDILLHASRDGDGWDDGRPTVVRGPGRMMAGRI